MKRRRAWLTASALLVAACAPPGNDATPPADRPAAPATATDATGRADTADTATPTDGAVCLAGAPFVTDGAIPVAAAGTGSGDARSIRALRWQAHDGCERFVIDLAAATGADAQAAGAVSAELLRHLGVVRVTMRGVERVAQDATDAAFAGPLARAAYVVRASDGTGHFVDVHLAAAAEAHVRVLDAPARVLVDLRPGGPALPAPPASATRVLVLAPRAGTASYPLTVTGYARTFEANVVARLEAGDAVADEAFTTATSWVDAWGHFSLTLRTGPAGPVTLHVGEYSARDGAWEGVRIELRMR